MKRIIFILVALALLAAGSFTIAGPIEDRVLDEQILGPVLNGSEESNLFSHPLGVSSRDRLHFRWPISHAKNKWGYSFWYSGKAEAGDSIMKKYRAQIVDALGVAGAEIIEEVELEASDSNIGFSIAYHKSKVAGEISATCNAQGNSLYVLEVTQVEKQ